MESGRLHVYLGALPAAGKTHAMLAEGRRLSKLGSDVVVGLVETHGRTGLDQLVEGLEIVPAEYSGKDDVTLGFNWQYLQEFLNNVGAFEITGSNTEPTDGADSEVKETDGDKVRVRESKAPTRISFEFKDANAATQICIDGDTSYDYKYVVMPLRI